MIGSNNSPLTMFNGGGGDAFQRGMAIGHANSPFATVGDALRSTLEKYNTHLSMQQEQANKLEQIKAEGVAAHPWLYDAQGNRQATSLATDPEATQPFTQLDPKTGKWFNRSTSLDPATGQSKVSWSPVSPNAPENIKQEVVNEALGPLLEQMKASRAGGSPQVPAAQGQGVPPGMKKQVNTKTGEVRYVPQ